MNPQDEQNLEQKFQNLEAEINSTPPIPLTKVESDFSLASLFAQFLGWFGGLSGIAKLAVIGFGVVAVLMTLKLFVQLVVSLIGLAFIGGIAYITYKAFLESKPSAG